MQTGMVGLRRKGRDLLRRLLRGGDWCAAFEGSPGSSREGAAMNDSRSDRPLFIGATRDLAYQKILAALEAMRERGRLDVPVIGAAPPDWSLVIQKHLFPLNHFSDRYGVEDGHISQCYLYGRPNRWNLRAICPTFNAMLERGRLDVTVIGAAQGDGVSSSTSISSRCTIFLTVRELKTVT